MKTNQVMIRKMGVFDVAQRTSDGYFNATALAKAWNETMPDNKREIDNFWKSTNLPDLMSEIAENELGIKSVDFTELKNKLSKTNKGKNGGTWLHPVLFVKFAMYLSPRFEYHVLKFVSDQMLAYRNEAGDSYKELAAAVSKIVSKDFMRAAMPKIAEAINYCVFNAHATMIRNQHGDEKKMRELFSFQRKVADLINDGFLTNFNGTMEYLRKKWRELHTPKVMLLPDKT